VVPAGIEAGRRLETLLTSMFFHGGWGSFQALRESRWRIWKGQVYHNSDKVGWERVRYKCSTGAILGRVYVSILAVEVWEGPGLGGQGLSLEKLSRAVLVYNPRCLRYRRMQRQSGSIMVAYTLVPESLGQGLSVRFFPFRDLSPYSD
jgi:hypothetical protein